MTYEHLEAVIRLVIVIGIVMPVIILVGLIEFFIPTKYREKYAKVADFVIRWLVRFCILIACILLLFAYNILSRT